MDCEQRESGLVVPVSKPEPPSKKYGPLELTNPEDRERAANALQELWQVTGLEYPCVLSGGGPKFAAHRWAWESLAHMLLGDDFECEQLT